MLSCAGASTRAHRTDECVHPEIALVNQLRVNVALSSCRSPLAALTRTLNCAVESAPGWAFVSACRISGESIKW